MQNQITKGGQNFDFLESLKSKLGKLNDVKPQIQLKQLDNVYNTIKSNDSDDDIDSNLALNSSINTNYLDASNDNGKNEVVEGHNAPNNHELDINAKRDNSTAKQLKNTQQNCESNDNLGKKRTRMNNDVNEQNHLKKKRGRPPKGANNAKQSGNDNLGNSPRINNDVNEQNHLKKKRGRPLEGANNAKQPGKTYNNDINLIDFTENIPTSEHSKAFQTYKQSNGDTTKSKKKHQNICIEGNNRFENQKKRENKAKNKYYNQNEKYQDNTNFNIFADNNNIRASENAISNLQINKSEKLKSLHKLLDDTILGMLNNEHNTLNLKYENNISNLKNALNMRHKNKMSKMKEAHANEIMNLKQRNNELQKSNNYHNGIHELLNNKAIESQNAINNLMHKISGLDDKISKLKKSNNELQKGNNELHNMLDKVKEMWLNDTVQHTELRQGMTNLICISNTMLQQHKSHIIFLINQIAEMIPRKWIPDRNDKNQQQQNQSIQENTIQHIANQQLLMSTIKDNKAVRQNFLQQPLIKPQSSTHLTMLQNQRNNSLNNQGNRNTQNSQQLQNSVPKETKWAMNINADKNNNQSKKSII